jgi:hypothetical protein
MLKISPARIIPILLLCLAAGCARTSAPRELKSIGDTHYVTVFSQNPQTDLDGVTDTVQSQKQTIADFLRLSSPVEKLTVYLFDSDQQLLQYLSLNSTQFGPLFHSRDQLQKYLSTSHYTQFGTIFWTADHQNYVAATQGDQGALRRGVTQFVLSLNYRDLPPWIAEGLAHHFETGAPLAADQQRPLLQRVAARIYPAQISELISIRAGSPLTTEQIETSWALTAYLLQTQPADATLHYVQWAHSGADSPKFFKQSYHQAIEQTAEQMIAEYGKKPK